MAGNLFWPWHLPPPSLLWELDLLLVKKGLVDGPGHLYGAGDGARFVELLWKKSEGEGELVGKADMVQ